MCKGKKFSGLRPKRDLMRIERWWVRVDGEGGGWVVRGEVAGWVMRVGR